MRLFEPSRPVPKIRHIRCLGFFVACSLLYYLLQDNRLHPGSPSPGTCIFCMMRSIYPFLLASLASSSSLLPRALVNPTLNIANQNALALSCYPITQPVVRWHSCYNAWEKMHDDLPTGVQKYLHFLSRHVRPYGPAGTMSVGSMDCLHSHL